MTQALKQPRYDRRMFAGAGVDAIRESIERDGWSPIVIDDRPRAVYPEHAHEAAKLLVFLRGSMEVETGDQRYNCTPGDRPVISGSMRHAARVGQDGCTFFWSAQVRGNA